jgi:translocation and assembly module TamB
MKKWIARISVTFLVLFFLTTGGVFFLIGTQAGTKFIVTQAEKQLDGQLQVGSATGTLLDRLELHDIFFESPAAGKTELGTLVLDWKSTDLLNLHFHIIALNASDINYTTSQLKPEASPEPESTAPITLPELALPITISVEKLSIDAFKLYTAENAEPITIIHTELSALWDTNGIQLQKLSFSMPEVTLEAHGEILPTGNYPLTLTTVITTLDPEYPSLTLHGEYGGDLQTLSVKEVLRGDIEADILGTLQNVINAPAWDITLNISNFTPEIFSPDVPGMVSGKITSTGTLEKMNITAQLASRDQNESYVNWDAALDADMNLESQLITLNQCNLAHLNSPAALTLSGTADMNQQLAIALNWKSLQWPLTSNAEYSSPAGTATLTGTIDDFHLALQTSLSGTAIPDIAIQLTSTGNSTSAQDIQLSLDTLDGNLAVNGNVTWTPRIEWQVTTTATHLNPGVQYPEWAGNLDWIIHSAGHIEESGVIADVSINNLQGSLRELPIAGSGDITVAPESIQIDKLLLSSGKAKVTAQGLLGDVSDLKWDIQISDFSDLLPDSSGQLTASGTIRGEMTKPKVTANIKGSAIVMPQVELQELHLSTDLDLSWEEPFTIDLSVNNLTSGETLLPKLILKSSGELTNHTLQLFANHKLADLSLALQGGYKEEQWQGSLNKLILDSKDMGKWQSTKTAQIMAAAKAATLTTLCLARQQSNLCISGTWDSENLQTGGKASLTNFPLNWLSVWFPETLEDLGGTFSFDAEANMQEQLNASAHAKITPGEIKYSTIKETGTLSHEGLKLDLQVADNGLDADLWLSVSSNIISGEMHSPDLLQSGAEHSPAINGIIKINAENFTIVETLFEDVENLKAQVATDFSIAGTLASPQVDGKGKLHIKNMLIPVAGLELSDTSLDILANNSNVTLNGIFNSGRGSMALEGKAFLDAEKNYPAFITLKGTNFRLVNLPDIQVYLSSDLSIEKTQDLTLLSGTVTIPKADILLRNLPKGTETASPDIVIIQEQKEEVETQSPMQMDLKVSLGEKVYFAGLGINAFIDGQLAITAEPEEQMFGSGEFHIRQGSYRAYGQDLVIEKGVISFPGGPLTQPGINLRATRTVGDVVAGISAIGPASKPRITTFSRPAMSESQILSYIITGSAPSTGGAKLSVGRQINNKLSVSVGTDTKTGESEFVARYRLSNKIHVETTTGTSSNAADIFYTTELGGKTEEDADKKEKDSK